MTGAGGIVIYDKPLLIAPLGGPDVRESLPAVERAPHRDVKGLEKAEIVKTPGVIRAQHRVTSKDVSLQNAGERPGSATIVRPAPAGLPEVGSNAVKLPPTDDHPVVVRRVHGDGGLVRGVARDVLATQVDVDLATRERAFLRDLSRRNACSPQGQRGRRVIVLFVWSGRDRLGWGGLA